MPESLVQIAVLLLPLLLIVAVERVLARRCRPGFDVYEPGGRLSPAEAADIEAGFEPVYLPDPFGPAPDFAFRERAGTSLQAEADAAEEGLRRQFTAFEEHLRSTDRLLAPAGAWSGPAGRASQPASGLSRFPAADPARPAPAPASADAPGRSKR